MDKVALSFCERSTGESLTADQGSGRVYYGAKFPAALALSRPACARRSLLVKSLDEFHRGVIFPMWEQLTPADIERSKHRLATRRIEAMTRHAEELKALDTDRAEIDAFEQLVAGFASKYLSSSASDSSSTTASEKTTDAPASSQPSAALPEATPPRLEVHHQSPPNFGIPVRRLLRG